MGVPKFFRFISERYPCLNQLIKEHQISDFDNLYLDMNGIIHSCSHPDDSNPHFRITEEKIFAEIFHYIAFLFQLIRPKKLFFMAIDGVAPRAKMNQQRGRRFRTAKEALDIEKKAKEKGETLPEGKRFDSNCITPGTVFMARLHEQLRYFVKQKISSDSLWGRCRIVLSGHETPGEGEHKIMDYIRYLKTQPDHDPNTRHCLYGLDADLIMLGLCTHEPNFSLLREEVKFGRQAQKSTSPTENDFFLLHLSLLKDYIEQEFICIQDKIPFGYDIERIIDDWVLMGFLVGNDFIPPLPHLHIHTNGFLLLYETYKKVIVKLDGYMNEGGILNLQRFEVFMKELSSLDKESFQDVYADLRFFETKTGRRLNAQVKKDFKNYVPDDNETFGALDMNTEWTSQSEDLKRLILETNMIDRDDSNSDEDRGDLSDDDEMFNNEFKLHRHDYYKTKLDYENVTPEVLQQQAECYVRAIQWVLHYYYQGCCSWSWYYPHHYAPFITDIVDFKNMNLNFDMGTPFKPFEQLLAVLPAASKDLLPEPFHHLMTNPNSPIYSYYPENFLTDLNGKQNEWEAVVLIPFIDETQLLSAMEPFYQVLTDEELKRNSHGPMLIYNYTVENLGEYHAPEYFPPILSCHAREVPLDRLELQIPPEKVIRGPLPNPKRGTYFPGIPTLKTLQFTSHFTKAQVKVFDYPSRNENCILNIKYDHGKELPLEELAEKLLGKVVWVSWPHLQRARICQVSNSEKRIRYISKDTVENEIRDDEVKFVMRESNSSKISEFEIDKRTIVDHLSRRLGIDAGEITTIVHATSLKGFSHTFGTDGTIIDRVEWCKVPSPYPLQAIIEKLDVPPLFTTRNLPIHEVLPKGDKVFLKANPYYGCSAEVVDSTGFAQTSRIKVSVLVEPEPKILPRTQAKNSYLTPYNAATRSGISSFLLSRLTGCIFVSRTQNCEDRNRSVNIGLNIKFSKKNEEVAGYTKRKDTKWLYSEKCVDLILEYHNKFPELIETLEAKVNKDRYALSDLFPEETGETKLFEVANWLKDHPYKKAATRSCDSEYLEPDEIVELYNSIVSQKANLQKERKSLLVQVKPHRLFKPELHGGKMPPDISVCEYKLYDRVINVNSRSTVPLGLKGTIVGVSRTKHPSSVNLSETLNSEPIYLILFDEPFIGGASEEGINESRMFKLQSHSLLNITRGRGDLPEVNKGIRNIKLNSDTTSNITDNYRNLRNNDGHNSAFANYTSPTKHINDSTWYNSKYKAPKVPQPNIQQQVSQDIGVLSNNDEQSNTLKSMLNINKNSTNPKTVSSNTHGEHAGQTVPTLIPPWQFMSPYQTMASHSPMSPNPSMIPNSLMSSHPPNLSMLPNPSMQSHPMMPSNPSMQSQPPMPPNPSMQSQPPMPPHPSLQSHPLILPNPSMQSHPPNPSMQSHPPNPSMQSHPPMPPNPSMQSHPPMPPNPTMPSHPMMQPYPSMPPYPSMQPQSLMGPFQPQAGLNFGMQYQNVSNVFPGVTIYNQTNNHPQVPTNIQLPFPNKFLDQPSPSNNVSSRQRTAGAPGAAGNAVPSQFIPLQAVRQRNNGPPLGPQKPYRKPSTENDSVPGEVSDKMGNSTTNFALSTSQLTQVSTEGQKPPTRVKQRKSRLAANFGGRN